MSAALQHIHTCMYSTSEKCTCINHLYCLLLCGAVTLNWKGICSRSPVEPSRPGTGDGSSSETASSATSQRARQRYIQCTVYNRAVFMSIAIHFHQAKRYVHVNG